jgi:phosphoribosylaminoimidazolecarboxamide formyltransferase/IMP cyclohydrolase
MSTKGKSRAILSVYDKRGISGMGRFLAAEGLELVSSGGTAAALKEEGMDVRTVSEITGFPELLDGRVKTLHPVIHAGILARLDHDGDRRALADHGVVPVSWVVVNLYPFTKALEQRLDESEQIEFIDIGGPTLLRAAAKNYRHVVAVCDPADYPDLQEQWRREGEIPMERRRQLAQKVFETVSGYDLAVARYLSGQGGR